MSDLQLSRLSLPSRVLVTLFVLTMGAGYLSALLQLHATHGTRDDVIAAFHGSAGHTRLLVMAEGDMRQHLKSDAELETIRRWVAGGSTRESWEPVQTLLAARCTRCHSEGKEKEDAPLDTYENVQQQVKIQPLISTRRLTALTHIHVLAMGCLFGLLGAIFCATSFSPGVRLGVVALPFVGMSMDFSGWWLARLGEGWVDMILVGGALTGLGLGALVIGVLTDVWVLPTLRGRGSWPYEPMLASGRRSGVLALLALVLFGSPGDPDDKRHADEASRGDGAATDADLGVVEFKPAGTQPTALPPGEPTTETGLQPGAGAT